MVRARVLGLGPRANVIRVRVRIRVRMRVRK